MARLDHGLCRQHQHAHRAGTVEAPLERAEARQHLDARDVHLGGERAIVTFGDAAVLVAQHRGDAPLARVERLGVERARGRGRLVAHEARVLDRRKAARRKIAGDAAAGAHACDANASADFRNAARYIVAEAQRAGLGVEREHASIAAVLGKIIDARPWHEAAAAFVDLDCERRGIYGFGRELDDLIGAAVGLPDDDIAHRPKLIDRDRIDADP